MKKKESDSGIMKNETQKATDENVVNNKVEQPLEKVESKKKKSPVKKAVTPIKKAAIKKASKEEVKDKPAVSADNVIKAPVKKAAVKKAPVKKAEIKKAPKKAAVKVEKEKKEPVAKPNVTAKPIAATKPKTVKAANPAANKVSGLQLQKINFHIRYYTKFGQTVWVMGNHPVLGNNEIEKALPLEFIHQEAWAGQIEIPTGTKFEKAIAYNYFVKDQDGEVVMEWGNDKEIDVKTIKATDLFLIDSWNLAGFNENTFYTKPFHDVLLKHDKTGYEAKQPNTFTHTFKVKAPLLGRNEVMCIAGSDEALNLWDVENPLLMGHVTDQEWYSLSVDLSSASFPLFYKYGVYDIAEKKFVKFEQGDNRSLFDSTHAGKLTVVNDGFAWLPNDTFKGAGVSIPVFSLRSNDGLGIGEFNDLKKLVDWAKVTGLKLVQILPVNDTIATYTKADSYPYAAISAFALHPIFLHLPAMVNKGNEGLLSSLEVKKASLNELTVVDFEKVLNVKLDIVKQIFQQQKDSTFGHASFQSFFAENSHWLVPYAAFSYFRDTNKTADFTKWSEHKTYDAAKINKLASTPASAKDEISIYYFIQYHLHLQLLEATAYAHKNGIIVKGDIPIGIYRHSCDAWQDPALFNMDMQAGAPPDDFAAKGQNWGFPTYNWQQMQKDGFGWWKKRFAQMSYYFDAFRIDHILGFFRIWSIPNHSVEGVMGHFVPAIPVSKNEFSDRGISFDNARFTKPYITDSVLNEIFGDKANEIAEQYLNNIEDGTYSLKPAFDSQRKVETFFEASVNSEENEKLKQGLYDLISNVILFEEINSKDNDFHFRIAIDKTSSFQHLPADVKHQIWELYINYFFRRQDNYWLKEALHKLPELKGSTNMLICGEDLGMVPDCVPGVMKQLGILSLEIQRMPKDPSKMFFHPNDAPYLSVVTPSTHDMSTIRGWWEEDKYVTQQFYTNEMGQYGAAPAFCEPWINKSIVLQNLYSPAMWSIFQLQDLLGISPNLRSEDPLAERINIPADPKHIWCYRMHLTLEDLLEENEFSEELLGYISHSGR